MNKRPGPIVVTPGEAAGVGPELCVRLPELCPEIPLLLIADRELLERAVCNQKLNLPVHSHAANQAHYELRPGAVNCIPVKLNAKEQPGHPDPANARYLLDTLDIAVAGCLEGRFHALVTGPLNKAAINQSGIPFTGHTEYLADRCGVDKVVMMLTADTLEPPLRVALATTHLPLRKVPGALTSASLRKCIEIVASELTARFAIENPTITVLGLNPHAGESGHLGMEEVEIIEPLLEEMRDLGFDLHGPLAADTAFRKPTDAILAMYHDQGLPVLKYAGFGNAVNVTLGLPIIRTSVDHGTALQIAGTGTADPASLVAATRLAARLGL